MNGKFRPKNISKYKGDPTNIVYRSSWELKMMNYFDGHKDVIWWQSEELAIRYVSPLDSKFHRYFVDFVVKMKDINGKIKTVAIEVKPKHQTMPPKKPEKVNRSYIKEVMVWGINEAKWLAATEYCADRKWEFEILTEDQIFGKFNK